MSGAFLTSREIFDNPIWKNIVHFRLFFLIYGNAMHKDGVRVADDLILNRGEWCRSTRKLQQDLAYIENRQIKRYSTSVINRAIKALSHVEVQKLCTRSHELGTVFTVINYDQYQVLDNYKKSELGTELGTVLEQSGNNKKYVKNEIHEDIKDLKDLKDNSHTNFKPPSLNDVQAYCIERKNHVDAEMWLDFYTSKGWMVGKNKMKDWKAAVRTWEKGAKRGESNAKHGQGTTGSNSIYDQLSL